MTQDINMTITVATISDHEIQDIPAAIPYAIYIRNLLNKEGFKFEDDGSFSSIINENPIPLGTLTQSYDVEKRLTTLKQEI